MQEWTGNEDGHSQMIVIPAKSRFQHNFENLIFLISCNLYISATSTIEIKQNIIITIEE